MNPIKTPTESVPGALWLEGKPLWINRAIMVFGVCLPIAATLAAAPLLATGVIHLSLSDFLVAAALYSITGLGVTVGFHRLFTHRSFEAHPAVEIALAILGTMAVQGTVASWSAIHRRHHRYSDLPGDPHSPKELHQSGFGGALRALYYVHFSRLFTPDDTAVATYAPDLLKEPRIVAVDRLSTFWVLLTYAVPALAGWYFDGGARGALQGMFWGGLVRVCLGQNTASFVNSLCHMWGSAEYTTTDESKNNLFVGLAAFGEGWHNTHHAFPASARQGLRWWQLDLSYGLIALLRSLGLAWNVKVPDAETQARKRSPSYEQRHSPRVFDGPRAEPEMPEL